LFSGLAFSGPTPTVFGFVNTLPAFILFLTAGKLFGWIEPPRLRMEAAAAAGSTDRPTFYEGLDGDGNPRTSVKFADAAGTSNAVGAEPPEGSRIPETAFIVTETTENMTRLRELDGDGELVAETDLFPNKRDMGDQRLVMLPGGTTAMLVWVKEKSAKKQEVWLHFFDLP
jgi:hypothetical protein